LDRLQAAMGGERFAVLALATGRNLRPAIDKFLAEGGISHLTVWRDPGSD
ncbi:MAG: TlpA family protein disulfide reductase, partial [Alphaproteobacteria bacterium]|nr:TlpA family protein disulfide reductase [Alphaproteobacteria bacterium]